MIQDPGNSIQFDFSGRIHAQEMPSNYTEDENEAASERAREEDAGSKSGGADGTHTRLHVCHPRRMGIRVVVRW